MLFGGGGGGRHDFGAGAEYGGGDGLKCQFLKWKNLENAQRKGQTRKNNQLALNYNSRTTHPK